MSLDYYRSMSEDGPDHANHGFSTMLGHGRRFLWLTQGEFDTLLQYDRSFPTGTTIGKRWKRQMPWHVNPKVMVDYVCEYVPHPNPERVGIIYYMPIIVKARKGNR